MELGSTIKYYMRLFNSINATHSLKKIKEISHEKIKKLKVKLILKSTIKISLV
jgi:hypothetical protein